MAARYPDYETLIATNFVEADKKAVAGMPKWSKNLYLSTKSQLRVMDEQDALNRFKWYNLPEGIDQNTMERVLYYRYQGALFYIEELERFYFLPYCLKSGKHESGIDEYGRYLSIGPLPFFGKSETEDPKKMGGTEWLTAMQRKPIYDVMLPEEVELEHYLNGAVLLCDYSKQISQTGIPRQQLSEQIISAMAECIPFMRTALINSTGIEGMRVDNEDDQSNVAMQSAVMQAAALNGDKWIPIIGRQEFQQLTNGPTAKAEEFLLAMQALDNYRLSTHGLSNGGLFLKRAHMLEGEQEMQNSATSHVLIDGLENRLRFCDIANSVFGTNMYVEITEDPGLMQQQVIPETDGGEESEGEENA